MVKHGYNTGTTPVFTPVFTRYFEDFGDSGISRLATGHPAPEDLTTFQAPYKTLSRCPDHVF